MDSSAASPAPARPPARDPGPSSTPGTPPAGPGARRAWYLYDVGISVIDALMITFVFTTYLTSASFGTFEETSQVLSRGTVAAAVLIAFVAPLIGWLSDRTGRRAAAIAALTGISVLCTAACAVVRPDEQFLLLGVGLISAANAAKELAVVDYYAILPRIAAREEIGRLSGRGWAAGYIGSILATAFVLFGFVTPGFLGLPTHDALNIRAVALFCAAWCAVFALPVVISQHRRERAERAAAAAQPSSSRPSSSQTSSSEPSSSQGPQRSRTRANLLTPYREIGRLVLGLWRRDRRALHFLVASAVFRDGLSAVFTFGGVIAAGTFGFTLAQVMVFAIAGNLVAGLGALLGGQLDDRFGPKPVIMGALLLVIVAGSPLIVLEPQSAFWVCGLLLCLAVGPAQAASRSYLGRLTADGTEGALYGLYATTGRAVSFLAPLLFGLAIGVFGEQRYGILGILVVIVLGLVLMIGLPSTPSPAAVRGLEPGTTTTGRPGA